MSALRPFFLLSVDLPAGPRIQVRRRGLLPADEEGLGWMRGAFDRLRRWRREESALDEIQLVPPTAWSVDASVMPDVLKTVDDGGLVLVPGMMLPSSLFSLNEEARALVAWGKHGPQLRMAIGHDYEGRPGRSAPLTLPRILEARLLHASGSDLHAAMSELVALDPVRASALLRDGLGGVYVLTGHRLETRDLAPLLTTEAIEPLLRHPDATVRTAALTALDRVRAPTHSTRASTR